MGSSVNTTVKDRRPGMVVYASSDVNKSLSVAITETAQPLTITGEKMTIIADTQWLTGAP